MNHTAYTRRENGFVLILTLIFMVVLTILGLGLGIATTDEEKMARNFRDRDVAFAAAEAALREGELRVTGAYKSPYDPTGTTFTSYTEACTNGLCNSLESQTWQPIDQLDFFSGSGIANNSVPVGSLPGTETINGLAGGGQPRYMIELVATKLPGNGTLYAYRITAQARGRLPNTRVTLQEVFVPSASYEAANP